MSQENVEIVRAGFAAFQQGENTRMLEFMADDLITHRPDPDNATYHGKEGFFQAMADWVEGFQDWNASPEEYVEARDAVVVKVHQTARGEGSGVPVESHFWFVFALREGKIARLSFHTTEEEAFEAAQLTV
ncbi:MAG: nuclear transport factor 2 family protein [Actinomycetota bacterium]|nr:nuclear transport factor 2 family protein [Actinomycetota bacterium]